MNLHSWRGVLLDFIQEFFCIVHLSFKAIFKGLTEENMEPKAEL